MPDRKQVVWILASKKGGKISKISLDKPTSLFIDHTEYRKAHVNYHLPNKRGMGRAKGNALERIVAKKFGKWIYDDPSAMKRTPLSGGWASGKAGDIILDHEKARNKHKYPDFHIYVECRSYKEVLGYKFFNWIFKKKPKKITEWLLEVESKTGKRFPCLVVKDNKSVPYVIMLLRWLPAGWVPGRVLNFAKPIQFKVRKLAATGVIFPLSRLGRLGDGKEFLKRWREDGGSSYIRRISGNNK